MRYIYNKYIYIYITTFQGSEIQPTSSSWAFEPLIYKGFCIYIYIEILFTSLYVIFLAGVLNQQHVSVLQNGPLPVINGVITPINGLIKG